MPPAASTTKPTADTDTTDPGVPEPSPAATGRMAIGYAPEIIESALRRCTGGDISWVFGFSPQGAVTFTLSPGLNMDVDVTLWERAKELDAVQELLVQSVLQEIPLPAVDDGTTAPWLASLSSIPPLTARAMIHHCRDLDQLEAWLKVENREQTRQALARRIKERQQGLESIQGMA